MFQKKKHTLTILLFTILFFVQGSQVYGQKLKSTLPIVIINTQGKSIEDAFKINVQMKLVDNGIGKVNTDTSTVFAFSGTIGIEYRGSSSQSFPKKPYSIETRDAIGEDADVSFFGWPKESDYILFASYNEKSFLHNVMSMTLARELGMYASRTKYVEVMINGEYQGLYVFMEKIKRDKGRVDIEKMQATDNNGDDVTGGYILKIDKFTGDNNSSFNSKYKAYSGRDITFQYDTPESPTIQQSTYIQQYISDFETALKGTSYKDTLTGYRKFIDVPSFVNFFLMSEVTRNMDAYRISTYLHKNKESKGGKLKMGPVWDFDICYGNADYCDGNRYDLFAYEFNKVCPQDFWQVPFWWERLMEDPYFLGQVKETYSKERTDGIFNSSHIYSLIDSLKNTIQAAQERNFIKWPILGQYIWPQPAPIPNTWKGETDELVFWVSRRLLWLDEKFLINTAVENERISEQNIKVFPNPANDQSLVSLSNAFSNNVRANIYDISGKLCGTKSVLSVNAEHTFVLSELLNTSTQQLETGVYFIQIIDLINVQTGIAQIIIE